MEKLVGKKREAREGAGEEQKRGGKRSSQQMHRPVLPCQQTEQRRRVPSTQSLDGKPALACSPRPCGLQQVRTGSVPSCSLLPVNSPCEQPSSNRPSCIQNNGKCLEKGIIPSVPCHIFHIILMEKKFPRYC